MKLQIGFRSGRSIVVKAEDDSAAAMFASLKGYIKLRGAYVIALTDGGHVVISLADMLYIAVGEVIEWPVETSDGKS